jgi:hypothetical protein
MMEEKTNPYQIRDALEEFEASPYLLTKNTKIREYWLTSELFQVLRICFSNRDYTVRVEDVGGSSIEVRPDIIVEGKGRTYPIEIKRFKKDTDFDRLLGQVERYHSELDATRVFVFAFAADNKYLPENDEEVRRYVEKLEERDDTEVFVKGRKDVRTR